MESRNVTKIVKKRMGWFIVPILIVVTAYLGVVALKPEIPMAESAVVVIPPPTSVNIPGRINSQIMNTQPVNPLASLMNSQEMQDRIYDTYFENSAKANSSQRYEIHFVAQPQDSTLLVHVSGNNTTALKELADVGAKVALEVYQEKFQQVNPKTSILLHKKLDKAQKKLDEYDLAIKSFKEANKVADLSTKNVELMNNINDLSRLVIQSEAEMQAAAISRKMLLKQLEFNSLQEARLSDILTSDRNLTLLKKELLNAEIQYADTSAQYGSDHPSFKTAEDEVDILRRDTNNRITYLLKSHQWGARPLNSKEKGFKTVSLKGKPLSGGIETAAVLNKNSVPRTLTQQETDLVLRLAMVTSDLQAKKAETSQLRSHLGRLTGDQGKVASLAVDMGNLEREKARYEKEVDYYKQEVDAQRLLLKRTQNLTRVKYHARIISKKSIFNLNFIYAGLISVFLGTVMACLRDALDNKEELLEQFSHSLALRDIEDEYTDPPAEAMQQQSLQQPAQQYASRPLPPRTSMTTPLMPVQPTRVQQTQQPVPVAAAYQATQQPAQENSLVIETRFPAVNESSFMASVKTPRAQHHLNTLVDGLNLPENLQSLAVGGNFFLCAALAMTLAKKQKQGFKNRVCLVDTNPYAPKLHRVLGVENRWGLAELLTDTYDQEHFLRSSQDGNNMVFVPAGNFNITGLDVIKNLPGFMKKLQQTFDYVIISLPSLKQSALVDQILIQGGCEGFLLVSNKEDVNHQICDQVVEDMTKTMPLPWLRMVLLEETR